MIKVVKIGGNVVENEAALALFCRDFAALEGPKILVHGGGVLASELQKQLGQTPVKIEGRRVTDIETLKVVTMVYSGWCNKHIVSLLQSNGCNAIGLSGCDANTIKASRRAPRTLSDGTSTVDYGYVGDVCKESINLNAVNALLNCGLTPVFCAINHDGNGNLLNTNADTIASSLAAALGAQLLYCFELDGVLEDKDRSETLIKKIDKASFKELCNKGIIADGMLPKLENCFAALEGGASGVRILNSSAVANETAGTMIEL